MNLQGVTISTLVDDKRYPGSYTEMFDGSYLSSGVYFIHLESEGAKLTKKMSLIK